MLLIPLLVGAIAFLVGRGAGGARSASAPAIAPTAVVIAGTRPSREPRAPSPLLVLDGFLRAGQIPPPPVILCAIAEAELLGQLDVADEIIRAFILPVVEAAEYDAAMSARDANGPPWDRADGAHDRRGMTPPAPPRPGAPVRAPYPTGSAPSPAPGMRPQPHPYGGHGEHGGHPAEPGAAFAHPGPTSPLPRPIARPEDARVEFMSPPPVAPQPVPPTPPRPGHAGPRQATITVSGRSSPISGVHADDWAAFAARVAREQPTFHSAHHVGQFRQRRSRLAELGIDPESLVGSTEAQDAAFDADMRDAYRHALESGMIAEYRGHTIEIPADGGAAPIQITLSGVLGVVQAAGLEGAIGWLADPGDRQRFPHTTRAFLRTNGVF